MSDPVDTATRFWETKTLSEMSRAEWEALCDGCGKCCLNKLEDETSGEVVLTRVACRLLDDATCRCTQYDIRHHFVPDCIVLTPQNLPQNLYWMPETCAYKRLYGGHRLYPWHPLVSGDPDSVHKAGVSVQGLTLSEFDVADEDWEEHVIEEPMG